MAITTETVFKAICDECGAVSPMGHFQGRATVPHLPEGWTDYGELGVFCPGHEVALVETPTPDCDD